MGQGFDKKNQEKLFSLFGKLETEPGNKAVNPEGIGMGLSICKKIIERVGGSIDCFSRGLKKGSTFFFSMKMPIPKK